MRRGVVLLEVVVGCGLLAVLLAVCVQLLSVTALERRDIERRAIAMEEAANLIERVAAMPYTDITPEALKKIKLSPDVEQILPGGSAQLSVDAEEGEVPAKRVHVAIQWSTPAGTTETPARLTYWVYPPPPGDSP
jgi:hypothetical protein